MDNSEFEVHASAYPDDQSEEFLKALEQDPARRQQLGEIQAFDKKLRTTLHGVSAPENLAARLKTAFSEPQSSESEAGHDRTVVPIQQPRFDFRKLAVAASLVLAVALLYTVFFNPVQPTAAELAFGQEVMAHVYRELDEINAQANPDVQTVNRVVATVGGHLVNDESMDNLHIRFAKPCFVLPQNPSAHLALEGAKGKVNVIMINNSPVKTEFSVKDDRFIGIVIPMDNGNLVLIGEKEESLSSFRRLLADNVGWVI